MAFHFNQIHSLFPKLCFTVLKDQHGFYIGSLATENKFSMSLSRTPFPALPETLKYWYDKTDQLLLSACCTASMLDDISGFESVVAEDSKGLM